VVLAVVLAIALMLTGTFAYFSNASVVNKFINEANEDNDGDTKDVVLHDDFEGGPEKHVYVENTGEVDLFVRIKLQEYMDLTSATDRDPKDSEWTTHIPHFAVDDCGLENAAFEEFHDHFIWTMGGQKWYLPALAGSGVVNDVTVWDSSDPGVEQTLPAVVISMSAYEAMTAQQKASFVGWIYDRDGYAYWSQPLPAGTATGLLLQRVDAVDGLEETDYFYAINVLMEAVDAKDLPMWTRASGNDDGLGKPSVDDPTTQAPLASTSAAAFLNGLVSEEDPEVGGEDPEDGKDRPVVPGAIPGLADKALGAEVEIDNFWWIKIADYDDGTYSYALLVCRGNFDTLGLQAFGSSNSNYENSSLRFGMFEFYNKHVLTKSALKDAIVMPDISKERSVPSSLLAKNAGLSPASKHDAVFALSKTEGDLFNHLDTVSWWTRTANTGGSVWISNSKDPSGWSPEPISSKDIHARPALWVMCS